MANIIGTLSNDTLVGSYDADTINGLAGNDTITGNQGNDTLTGGGGKDQFVYDFYLNDTDTIIDFGGVGKGTNPTSGVITEVDTLNFGNNDLFTARNLLLTQNGSNLEITFEDFEEVVDDTPNTKVILQKFKLENLQNLKATGAKPPIGNILFNGQTSITDSFNVLDANSTDTSVGIKNTVTFLNDLDNNITGLDNSDDVINGQGGNDWLDGKSGNDLLRGGTGNDTLIGGAGDDNLNVNNSQGNNLLSGGDGNDNLVASGNYGGRRSISFGNPIIGNNTLNGGAGNDRLNASYSSGNNTLIGDAGDDFLYVDFSTGNNLLSGGAGKDILSVSGFLDFSGGYFERFNGSGNNTLNGGVGNDVLDAGHTTGNNTLNGGTGDDNLRLDNAEGNNLLSGGDGNDSFNVGIPTNASYTDPSSLVTQTVDGGKGDDLLSGDYTSATGGITSTFNATTNIGSITKATNRVSYKNIEQLNIFGTQYDDLIVGSNGNDTLSGGYAGNDTIDGGKGNDLLSVNYNNGTQGITTTFNSITNIGLITNGTIGVSYKNIEQLNIFGTDYDDLIVGSNGNDTLFIGGFFGIGGNDTIDGGLGDDFLSVDYRDVTEGITTSFNAISNIGSITAGTNGVSSYKNIERLNILGTQDDDLIVGSNGNDTLSTGGGNDTIDGGLGDDLLSVYLSNTNEGEGITTTFNATSNIGSITAGTNGVSYKNIERLDIFGTDYDDLIVGSNGNDTISTRLGNDTIDGGLGDDVLSVNYNDYNPNDVTGDGKIISSTFNATTNIGLITVGTDGVSYKNIEQLNISGTLYDDLIVGSNGNDTLKGYSGNDILTGSKGNDTLIGEYGTDTFSFNSFNEGVDSIDDFNTTNELIQVSAAGFGGGLSLGILSTNQFTLGASATTNQERFIYNAATGGLFFDLDGSASGFTQVKFAQLSPGLSVSKNNFVVV
ncbi:calcium-binding protein [Nostoc sp. FACHB-888]|uniref:beta strand repeat-containing protein n=1 Tax=Nostoc sp. FACHB-888 TaxID=2692842 RepID=UPI0016852CBA|nr:calcium-binding protein [Nostoc sp. FACHB-888]MBD2248310.1 calcium-binding protein [Nostoc sp. FACHB-888]